MPKTYTIAHYAGLLLACAPDGDEDKLTGEIYQTMTQGRFEGKDSSEISTESGLILTNDEPEDQDRIVWQGHDCGWLTDEHGEVFTYAIRAGNT